MCGVVVVRETSRHFPSGRGPRPRLGTATNQAGEPADAEHGRDRSLRHASPPRSLQHPPDWHLTEESSPPSGLNIRVVCPRKQDNELGTRSVLQKGIT